MKRILAIACCLLFPLALAAGDWTHWRGPFQSGFSPETGLPEKFSLDPKDADNNLVWRAPYPCRSTPLVMNGRVYLINNVGEKITEQERVVCLNADTGKLIWEYKFNVWHTDIVSARLGWTNLAADPATERVFAHGTQGLLLCFEKDGKVRWQRSLSEEFGRITGYGGRIVSPIVVDDLVVVGMLNSSWGDQGKGGARWAAFHKDTGAIVWWSEPGGQPKDTFYSTPAVAVIGGQKLLITGGAEGGIYAMKAGTGEKVWSYPLGTAMINTAPVVQGDLVYVCHGEGNPDNNILGRVACLDASAIENGQPKLVWQKDGVTARYASPIVHKNIAIFPDDISRLHAFEALTGKKLFVFNYGRESRGSPVLADGKIYAADVDGTFNILKLEGKKCMRLHEETFFSKHGKGDVELNGSPAVANGRVYFATNEETYCIGAKTATKGSSASESAEPKKGTKTAWLQLVPADVTVHPGATVKFELRAFDEFGNLLEGKVPTGAEWTLPTPPLPPGAKAPPPALKGQLKDNVLTVDEKMPSQQGYVEVVAGSLKARARVRVAPRLPYKHDFEKVPDGAVPGGWVNTQGKFLVKTLKDGNKVLAKVTDKASPLLAKGNAFIGVPSDKDYTIEADVQGGKVGTYMPEIGLVANRYTFLLAGSIQKLRIVSWDALPRVDRTIPFAWEPDVWYSLKLTVDLSGKEGVVKGKCWKKGEKEPTEWSITVTDPLPNAEGAPALYAYVTGIPEGGSGTDIFFDNVRVTPNKK